MPPQGGDRGGGGFPGGGGDRGGDKGPGGPGGPGQGGPGGPGGFGGPPLGAVNPTMTFQANINNLLNNTQLGSYSGVLTSPFFGKAQNARPGRSIELQLRLSF